MTGEDPKPCASPPPWGGPGCDLPAGHDTHTSDSRAWTTDYDLVHQAVKAAYRFADETTDWAPDGPPAVWAEQLRRRLDAVISGDGSSSDETR